MDSFNNFARIATEFDHLQALAVTKTCFDLEAAMKAQIRSNGQIDTGFMWGSVYVRLFNQSTYAQVGAPPKGAQAFAEVAPPPNNKTGFVAVAASYGLYQNYGTSRLPARPFVEPSIEQVRPDFEAALAAIESKLGAIR